MERFLNITIKCVLFLALKVVTAAMYGKIWRNFLWCVWDLETFYLGIIIEFERKVDVQDFLFGWLRFENRYFLNY